MIQVAVPKSVAQSSDAVTVTKFTCGALREAIHLSKEKWQKKGLVFPAEADLARVDRCQEELLAPAQPSLPAHVPASAASPLQPGRG